MSTKTLNRVILPLFVVSIFLSAFLLFSIQPLFAKMVLPQLGGAPGVWSVAMVFFQAALLAGYLYAHVLARYLPIKLAVLAHLAVTALGFTALPFALSRLVGAPPVEGQVFWLLALFTLSIGLPFFALSANGPLLQAWFSTSGHRDAEDPYFLYAASNTGSLLALLSYPVLFEPNLTLAHQSGVWAVGYGVMIAALALVGLAVYKARPLLLENNDSPRPAPLWRQRFAWTGLSFIASGLLVAVTAHLSTDVAAVPFLWVLPLALYLLTFIIAFSARPLISLQRLATLTPFAVMPMLLLLISGYHLIWPLTLAFHLLSFFTLALLCHLTLFTQRPSAVFLTQFYFYLSLGGVLGGIFAALLSQYLFSTIAEYPILIVAAFFAFPGILKAYKTSFLQNLLFVIAVLLFAAMVGLVLKRPYGEGIMWLTVLVIVGTVLIADRKNVLRFQLLVAGALLFMPFLKTELPHYVTKRSFFGVHRVYDTQDGVFRVLQHGTTIHGAESNIESQKTQPLTYYAKDHNFGQMLTAFRARRKIDLIGAIGLGSGSMACHLLPGEHIRFFEIDPTVVTLATTEFSFLKNCAPDAPIVLGDARLTLSKEPENIFDVLIVDAFTSDSVPVHLLTQQAIKLYFSKLKDDGIVLLHISNRNLEMRSMLSTSAKELGLAALYRQERPQPKDLDKMVTPSEVVVLAKNENAFGALVTMEGWKKPEPSIVAAWTDDYSNIFGAMMRRLLYARYDQEKAVHP